MSKKEQKKGKAKEAPEAAPKEAAKKAKPKGPQEPSRLHVRYAKEIVPTLMKHFNYKNVMAVSELGEIVINIGLRGANADAQIPHIADGGVGRNGRETARVAEGK